MHDQSAEHVNEASSLNRPLLATVLHALANPALTRLETDDLSRAVLQCLREMLAADNLAILLLTEDHTAIRIHTVLGVEEAVAHDVHIPLGRGFAGRIITQGIPIIVHDTSTFEILTPVLRKQLRSLLGVPLIVRQQVIGVLHVGMKHKYLFTDADIALLQYVADALAHAFERTLLIEAEQHEFEELIEAQLSAIVALVGAQQRVAIELKEAQQRVAIELVEQQLRVAIELVGSQQRMAIELVGSQQRLAVELVGTQLHAASELVKTQRHAAGELMGAQQHTADESVEQQLSAAVERVEQQLSAAGELVEQQLRVAMELVEQQLRVAMELVEAQQQVALELMEAQQRVRIKVLERKSELDTIFDAIMDGILVYDEQEQLLRSNKAAHRLLEAETHSAEQNTPSPASWRTTYQLRDAQGQPFSPQHLPLKRLLGGERIVAKQAVAVHLHTLDERRIQLSITGAPLYTEQGHLYGVVCVLRDVTTRKNMERRMEILDVLLQMVELLVKSSVSKEQGVPQDDPALATQQIKSNILALAQRLLGCSHAIIIGIHESTHILSPLALAGFSIDQEQQLRTALTGAHLSLLINNPSQIALLERQENVPFTITQSPLLPYLSPMRSSPNCYLAPIYVAHHLVGLLGIVFPENGSTPNSSEVALVTAINKLCALTLQYEQQTVERDLLMAAKILLNEQLQQVNKMQGDFISVVSHEFRTSLTTIEGFSNLLRSEDCPGEEVKEYANDIYIDAIRLHRMVTDLLDVEQMKRGKMQLHMEWVNMNVLLTTTVRRMEQGLTHHTLRLSLDEKLPPLEGDPDKLIQVITNLLSNAIKYSPTGGEILIKSTSEVTAVHVSIQDHGIGIASGAIENIFTPYHRINSTSTRYIQGTGLGLSLVREILHQHEGRIWVESTPGEGSTFHFFLPLSREIAKSPNEELLQTHVQSSQ